MGTGWNILIAILASVGVMSVVFLGYLVIRSISAGSRKKSRAGNSAVKKKKHETIKMVVWVCLANGFAWVWCSYVLAFLDKMQIAESLSQVAVTQIIGVVLVYGLKSAIENLSKNNHWPDKPTMLPTDTVDVISDASGDGTTGVG